MKKRQGMFEGEMGEGGGVNTPMHTMASTVNGTNEKPRTKMHEKQKPSAGNPKKHM